VGGICREEMHVQFCCGNLMGKPTKLEQISNVYDTFRRFRVRISAGTPIILIFFVVFLSSVQEYAGTVY
jgi:hypothetical protein